MSHPAQKLVAALKPALRAQSSVLRQSRNSIPASSLAGPSRLPSRLFATESSVPSSTISSSPISGHTVRSRDVGNDEEPLPSNITFQGFENEVEEVPRALRLHDSPSDPTGPRLLPLSSLASSTPTLAADGDEAIALPSDVFGLPIRKDILHRNVVWYLSTLRQGNQSTKTRSTVSYSGRKLRQQKGTGKARVGDASSGIRRGGAPVFALHPRDHAQLLPRKIRELGVCTALSSKLNEGYLRVVPSLTEAAWEGTNEARRALCDAYVLSDSTPTPDGGREDTLEVIRRFGTPKDLSVLFVYPPPGSIEEMEKLEKFHMVTRNLPGVDLLCTDELTVWHILKYKWTVLEKGAVDALSGEDILMDEMEEGLLDAESDVSAATNPASVPAPATV